MTGQLLPCRQALSLLGPDAWGSIPKRLSGQAGLRRLVFVKPRSLQ